MIIKTVLIELKDYEGQCIKSPVYGFQVKFDVEYTKDNIDKIYKYIKKLGESC